MFSRLIMLCHSTLRRCHHHSTSHQWIRGSCTKSDKRILLATQIVPPKFSVHPEEIQGARTVKLHLPLWNNTKHNVLSLHFCFLCNSLFLMMRFCQWSFTHIAKNRWHLTMTNWFQKNWWWKQRCSYQPKMTFIVHHVFVWKWHVLIEKSVERMTLEPPTIGDNCRDAIDCQCQFLVSQKQMDCDSIAKQRKGSIDFFILCWFEPWNATATMSCFGNIVVTVSKNCACSMCCLHRGLLSHELWA